MRPGAGRALKRNLFQGKGLEGQVPPLGRSREEVGYDGGGRDTESIGDADDMTRLQMIGARTVVQEEHRVDEEATPTKTTC